LERNPWVSIITPTFNRSGYLRQAIASVLAQTFTDFEIIIVDDGSTDDTSTAVASFGSEQIVYLRQQNAGRSIARNRGLAEARGQYIAFLDDDDLYLPQKLAAQASHLDNHPEIGLVAGGSQIISADGTLIRDSQTLQKPPELALPGCLYACPLLTCSVLLRRNWLDALDHWFDPAMDRAEDTDLWIRLLLAGCRMAWMPDVVSAYRQHGSNSQGDFERYNRSYLMLLDKLYARDDLPEAVVAERPNLYAHYHTVSACHAFAAGQIADGQQRLLMAAEFAPEAPREEVPPIVSSIVGLAQGEAKGDDAAMVNTVFNQLPSRLAYLRSHHRYALSALHMRRVFAAHAAHERPVFSDWMAAALLYPRWLQNRGVWSILVRDLILRRPTTDVKA